MLWFFRRCNTRGHSLRFILADPIPSKFLANSRVAQARVGIRSGTPLYRAPSRNDEGWPTWIDMTIEPLVTLVVSDRYSIFRCLKQIRSASNRWMVQNFCLDSFSMLLLSLYFALPLPLACFAKAFISFYFYMPGCLFFMSFHEFL